MERSGGRWEGLQAAIARSNIATSRECPSLQPEWLPHTSISSCTGTNTTLIDIGAIMVSGGNTWLVSIPRGALTEELAAFSSQEVESLAIPSFKVSTLDSFILLSDDLPKYELFFNGVFNKVTDTWRKLINDDSVGLLQSPAVIQSGLGGWKWNDGKYAVQRELQDTVRLLDKDMASIDSVMKSKLNEYDAVKGHLMQLRRSRAGDLSVQPLDDKVSPQDVIHDSEFIETLFVAVPKNLVKMWNEKFERLTSMVVPRSSRVICSDNEYTLVSVALFKRVHDEFVQKCRENKFVVRNFVPSEDQRQTAADDMSSTETTERELWGQLARLTRANLSESFQVILHLKLIQLFVESVLRYGLPASYAGLIIHPGKKSATRILDLLRKRFSHKDRHANTPSLTSGSDLGGEYQAVMGEEHTEFVLLELPQPDI